MGAILARSLLALGLTLGAVSATLSAFRASNSTAVAVTYGYPLIQYANALGSVVALVGTNNLYHEQKTASATEQPGDIRPQNIDTLYSKAAIDLSQSDVILTVPNVNDTRYFVVSFHDLWSGNFANLGLLRAADPGRYLLRIADQPWQVGFETPHEKDDSGYLGYINFPTIHGSVLSRIVAHSQPPSDSNNSATDVRAARAIQEAIQLAVVPRPGPRLGPSLTPKLLGNSALERLAALAPGALGRHAIQDLLAAVARFDPFNRPTQPAEGASLTSVLVDAGLALGQYRSPRAVDFALVGQLVREKLAAAMKLLRPYNNGWFDLPPHRTGSMQERYTVRSLAAYTEYPRLASFEALYPEWKADGAHEPALAARESYILTFPSGKPAVDGFWSLSVYDAAGHLIPNALNRYSLDDRSNLTYSNGELVYGKTNRSDAFSILVQPADIVPPANWTSNWLPAPAGGGRLALSLHLYGPTSSLKAGGSYKYLIVSKQAAVSA